MAAKIESSHSIILKKLIYFKNKNYKKNYQSIRR